MRGFQNFYLKLLSFVLALTLWFYVQGRETVETSLKFTLFFSDIHQNLYIDESSNSELVVWVKGGKPAISQLLKSEKKLDISLKGYKEGRYYLTITPFMLNLPKNVEITRIQPERIWFRLQRLYQKQVRVRADYSGKRSFKIEPMTVTVMGEKRAVDNIENILTEPFSDADSKKEIYVKLSLPSERVSIHPEKVKIIFR
ncbi:MAG: hypothetical protein OHK0040_03100 [bacterium]